MYNIKDILFLHKLFLCYQLYVTLPFIFSPYPAKQRITRFDARAQIALVELKGGSAVINTEVCDKI